MTHLLRLEPKWIVVMDNGDDERMIDREHFEQMVNGWHGHKVTIYYWALHDINDSYFQQDMSRYLSQHHTLNTIEGLKIPLT